MIIDIKKYLFLGVKEDLDAFFARAQAQGFLEFISITGKRNVESPEEIQHLTAALKILRKLPKKEPLPSPDDAPFALRIADRILILKAETEKLHEERRLLRAEIARVSPFGDFSMQDIDYIEREGHRKIQFFCMKTAKSHKTDFGDEVFYVGTDYDLDYFITVNEEAKHYPDMIEMRIDRPVGDLKNHLSLVNESIHRVETELKELAGHQDFLRAVLVDFLNDFNLASAKKEVSFPFENSLFAIEAWVPQNKIGALFGMTQGLAIHSELIAIENEEKVPTYMENKGIARIGEDLVHIYDTPATTDKDPSSWVFWSFALFFAIIVADGGYGLLFLALAAFLKFRRPQIKGQDKRMFKLFTILSASCVVWGVLTASYFGIDLSPKNALTKVSIFNYLAEKKADYHFKAHDEVYHFWIKDYPDLVSLTEPKEILQKAVSVKDSIVSYDMLDEFKENLLLEFSLLIGVIHISFSFLRYLWRNWAGLGWIGFMFGGYLYFPSMLKATSIFHILGFYDKLSGEIVGLQLLYGGIGLAVVLALIQKRLKGFGEIAHVVQVFADVLSYLRLYALALAGSIMASTFNDLGIVVGYLFGGVVILFGHSVNILLGTMAGVIHGLRLNFIEWYHYSFEGGGRLFKPLKRLKIK